MAFRRRPPVLASITDRLNVAFRERCRLDPFSMAELDLVQVWGHGGLLKMPRADLGPPLTADEAEKVWRRLEQEGYGHGGPPTPDEPIRDRVPATIGPDARPVTLLGDYAIVSALRCAPCTILELRCYDGTDQLTLDERWY